MVNIKQDELLKVVYTTPILKDQLDANLEMGFKINAIKDLKQFCETCKRGFTFQYSFCPLDGSPLQIALPEEPKP